ncbi:MAG: PP2C family protein-serine/threonine phosphatase [Limisphaerales bacterium]
MVEEVLTVEPLTATAAPLERPAGPGPAPGISGAAPGDLRSLVNHQLSLTADTPLEAAQKFFGSHDLEFIAVLENDRAIGLCARRQIGMALGSRYGFSLFSRHPVRDYLVPQTLVIRTSDSIHDVLKRLSARPDELFYTDVLLEDEAGAFLGSIFVRNLVRLQHGLLLDNIHLLEHKRIEIERKNLQMEQELIMAGKVQCAMLPQSYPAFPPPSPGVRFHHRYLPAGRVSGDFFHVRRISDRTAGVFICDVMGHGVRSAMITAMLRALVEEMQSEAGHPGELLERLNHNLYMILRQNDETMYATAIYLVLDTQTLQVCWATAGHPGPLRLRADNGSVETLPLPQEKRGKVLGLVEQSTYPTGEVALSPGDRLLLYTDGIYEIFNGDREFGLEGLVETLQRHSSLETPLLLDRLLATARAFGAKLEFDDDVCLLGIDLGAG